MIGNLYLILSSIAGAVYTYCLLQAHFLIVKLDREIEVPRSRFGEIRVRDLKIINAAVRGTAFYEHSKKALFNIQLSNFVAIAYAVLLVAIKLIF